ncbi:hypothetical protein LBMAG53_24250 [Planctomycetota bacterium]|nr:hypothetical protein LBMAG53_24250 [Planctomycetota bacterium]
MDEVESEADRLLKMHDGRLSPALEIVARQFGVIQGREQLLLTLATLSLTITGFSGPKIVESSQVAKWCLAVGLVIVLAGVLHILNTLQIRWLTQFPGTDREILVAALLHRNTKTKAFARERLLLGVGLGFYVASVVVFVAS